MGSADRSTIANVLVGEEISAASLGLQLPPYHGDAVLADSHCRTDGVGSKTIHEEELGHELAFLMPPLERPFDRDEEVLQRRPILNLSRIRPFEHF